VGTSRFWRQSVGDQTGPEPPYEGNHAAFLDRSSVNPASGTPQDWLVTKEFEMPENPEIHFFSRLTVGGNDGGIYRLMMIDLTENPGADPNDFANYVQLKEWNEIQLNPIQTQYIEKIVTEPDIPASAVGHQVRIAFVMVANNADRWLVDNVKVVEKCLDPENLTASGIGLDVATLGWDNPGGASSFEIEVVEAAQLPTGIADYTSNTNSYQVTTGLTPDTDYAYYVRALCTNGGADNISGWVGPFEFSTVAIGATCEAPIEINTVSYYTVGNTNNFDDDYSGSAGTGCTGGTYLNGDDVVYAYNATFTGSILINMRDTGPNAGIFVYNECADIGNTCIAGGTASPTSQANFTVPVTAGETYYIVISTSGTTQTTPYTLTIQQVNCTPPVGQATNNILPTSAELNWTNPGNASSWQVVVQPAGSGLPTASSTPETATTNTAYLADNLPPATSLEYYVRADCADGTFSSWAGPYTFMTTQVPVNLDYTEDFEGVHGWSLNNGTQTNKWVVGTAVNNGGANSLYISNDNGANNAYTITSASVVQAYKDIQIPATANQLKLTFDWKAMGQGTTNDYFRVWMVPVNYNPNAGTQITPNASRVAVGGNFNQSNDFVNAEFVINILPAFQGQVRRLVFEWRNDATGGTQPPAAIDNINLSLITCPTPTGVAIAANSATLTGATFNWGIPSWGAPGYDYYVTTGNEVPDDTTIPTNNAALTTNTVTLNNLNHSTNYNFWVRSNCGATDGNSEWIGPVNFNTLQVPANLDYVEDFEASHGWAFINGSQNNEQPNKWVVGTAVNNGGTKSLYITNDNGTTNAYTTNQTSVSHAYRDIQFPNSIDQLSLKFDWRAQGQGTTNDYFRVWLVPQNYNPNPGAQITPGGGRIAVGGNFNQNGSFTTADFVLPSAAYGGQVRRLVFEWRNDATGGTQPPAAIDNLNFSVITCPAPTNFVLTTGSVTQTGASFTWTGPTSVTPTYDYYISAFDDTPPTETTTPTNTAPVTAASLDLNNLNSSTVYYIWVRSNCGPGDESTWTGPVRFNTLQVPAPLDYSEDFEGFHGWTLINESEANQWVVGSATSNGAGTKSLYITNNGGTTNTYTTTTASVVHAYRDIQMPANIEQMLLTFDWKALGENNTDYLRVWLVPDNYNPTAGTQITPNSTRILLGGNYGLSSAWKTSSEIYDVLAYQGQVRRLVFEWRNNNTGGVNPPAAVDNVNVEFITCPTPKNLAVGTVTANSAVINWTAPVTVTPTYDYYVSPIITNGPTDTTTPTGNVPNNTVTITDFPNNSSNQYVWIRSNCGSDDESPWIGPVNFSLPQTPAVPNFSDNFEGPTNWTMSNGNQTNKWVIGTAVSSSASTSLYISDDDGETNTYTVTSSSVTHAYRDIQLPNIAYDLGVTFQWKAAGQGTTDRLRVWMVPVTFNPTPGTQITNGANRALVGEYSDSANIWNNVSAVLSETAYVGQVRRLVFEWRNDNSGGTQPPAAVDNINVKLITCPAVTNLAVNGTESIGTVELSWTPVGSETQWEIVIVEQGDPAPGTNPAGVIPVSGSPSHTVSLPAGTFYEFYVRPVCAPDDKGFWAGPELFSIFAPPACAKVDLYDEELNVVAPGTNFSICPGEDACVELTADFLETGATTSYEVETIDYTPQFPFSGGIEMNINEDDRWSPVFTLPSDFDFCFFGQKYSTLQVGSNGVIEFGSNYSATAACPWNLTGMTIPNTNFPIKKAIYGVYQDIDPRPGENPITNPSINYQVLGTYPCRAFVVNYSDIAQYSGTCQSNPAIGGQTSQIVFYEISNIIEIYVQKRVPCTSWPSGANGGQGVIGIQNAAGTVAYTPAGRNTGPWTAIEEAYRFTPNGPSNVEFEWLKGGDFFSNDETIEVCVTDVTEMTARAKYTGCGSNVSIIESKVTITPEEPIITTVPANLTECAPAGTDVTFDLMDVTIGILPDPENYEFTFYDTLDKAELGQSQDQLPTSYTTNTNQTLYIRTQLAGRSCYVTDAFSLNISQTPEFDLTGDATICPNSPIVLEVTPINFDQTSPDVSFTWTKDGGPALPDTGSSITVNEEGIYEVTVDNAGCITAKTVTIDVVATPAPDQLPDVTACESFTLPVLTNGTYYTATGGATGGGTVLNAGDPITTSQTIYIFAEGVDPICSNETEFDVTIVTQPDVIVPDNQVVCDSYELPPLAEGNYYDAPGGATGGGNMLAAGDLISTDMTIYVYADNGAAGCTDEKSFTVSIAAPPVPDNPGDQTACFSYSLPALAANNYYYTGSGQTGTQLNAGDVIDTSQTIYVWAETGATPNCTAEDSFDVTIIPSQNVVTPGDQTVCDSYTLPVLAEGNYYTAPGGPTGGGTMLNAGDPITTTQTIYVYVVIDPTLLCQGEASFTVTVVNRPTAQVVADVTSCDSYTLPPLNAGNSYYTGSGATGTMLNPGDPVTASQTIYVYAGSAAPNCFDESSFEVTILTTPTVQTPGDQTVCTSYTLPALAEGNYYTAPGGPTGGGTMLNAGDPVTATQTIYVYAASVANVVQCPAEASFDVTVLPAPIADAPANVVECDSYSLLPLTEGNYYTGPDGTGNMLSAGNVIIDSQTLYVYADNGICSDENSFTVTITPTPTLASISEGCEGGSYILGVVFGVDDETDQGNAAYAWSRTEGGAVISTDPTLTVTETGMYYVTVTPAGSSCSETIGVDVLTTACSIQRGISPNNDGKNDEFDLTALDVRSLSIFNRYGQEVYSYNGGYTNQWHGQGSGGDLPTGTYFYSIRRANGETRTGWVYINREE
jgi:gliding motility-associated-like protein